MGVVDSYALDFSLVQLPARVVVAPVRIVVPPEGDLVVGVGGMTHLDRIMNTEVFASPMVEVFESHKSSPTTPRAIPHATVAY
ncbi:Proline and serine-rich 1 [Gossypium arboreum]|uniref:Proline and serine-rich 1 n=1 Tax=Gossypium arboreum TaxID=29729 RepID=A0A0B0MI28_GOSAR|nr:Proline and serine-rich 1 [Gossypium arboreum]